MRLIPQLHNGGGIISQSLAPSCPSGESECGPTGITGPQELEAMPSALPGSPNTSSVGKPRLPTGPRPVGGQRWRHVTFRELLGVSWSSPAGGMGAGGPRTEAQLLHPQTPPCWRIAKRVGSICGTW